MEHARGIEMAAAQLDAIHSAGPFKRTILPLLCRCICEESPRILVRGEADRPERGVDVATNELAKLVSTVERQTTADGGDETAGAAPRPSRFSAPSGLGSLAYHPSPWCPAQASHDGRLPRCAYR